MICPFHTKRGSRETASNCRSPAGRGLRTSRQRLAKGDNALFAGRLLTATAQDSPPTSSRYIALYARQNGKWLIASGGEEAKPEEDEKWRALGIFAMVQGDETMSNDICQLALNKDGVLRGNYHNAVSDATTPVVDSLDKDSQRVAWTIEGQETPVYETGLYNLTQEETTLLAHFDTDRTEQYRLFRVQQQDDQTGSDAAQ